MLRALMSHRAMPIVLAMALTALPVAGYLTRSLDRLELDTVDARFDVRGDQGPRDNVVVVGFDPRTMNGLELRWPPPRRWHGRVIDELHRLGARVIAYDVQITSRTNPRDDYAVYDAADRAHNVVFATTETDGRGHTRVLGGDANLRPIGAVAANALVPPDKDGVIRRFAYQVDGLRSFAVTAARRAGARPDPAAFGDRGAWIDYAGGRERIRTVSVVDLIKGRVPRSAIAGRVAVVGATSPVLHDIHSTPTSRAMPGPEIQANAIATVLGDFPLTAVGDAAAVLLIVVLGVVPALLAYLLRRTQAALASVGLLILFLAGAQIAFDNGTIVPVIYPVAAWLLGAAAAVAGGYLQASAERDRLLAERKQFADFDPAIVDAVLAVQAGADEAIALDPEAVIAGYRIEQLIGRGGMGVVYEAIQLSLGRRVALKLIRPVFTENSVARERFKRESRMAASIEHPNVIPVYEAGEYEGVLFIAMRLVDGQDLASVLTLQPLDAQRAAALVIQVAAALDAAHAAGLVHRDVKPANILIATDDAGEHAYLTDFGLTKRLDAVDGLTTPGRFIGTIDYMSPEQIRGAELSAASDIYSLGCVVYHALVGRPPFEFDSDADVLAAHLHSDPPTLPLALAPLESVLARALAKQPEDRWGSASEFARELAAAAVTIAPGPAVATVAMAPSPPGRTDTAGQTVPGAVVSE